MKIALLFNRTSRAEQISKELGFLNYAEALARGNSAEIHAIKVAAGIKPHFNWVDYFNSFFSRLK